MANVKSSFIIGLTIALMLVGILLPIGLSDIVDYNGSYYSENGTLLGTNTTVATLVSSVIPIMFIISIIFMFLGATKKN